MPQNKNYADVEAAQAFVGGPNQTAVAETFTNALVEGKPMADDGSLYSTVQGAENAADSWVFVPPGTYDELITISTSGLNLTGVGYQSFIHPTSDGTAVTVEANDVTVQNLSIQTDGDSSTSNVGIQSSSSYSNLTCSRVTIRGAGLAGIDVDSDFLSIINCRIIGCGQRGVKTASTGGNVIYANLIEDVGDGLNDRQQAIRASNAQDVIIASNVIRNIGGGASTDRGILLGGADVITIGNRIHNTDGEGIYVGSDDSVIANNRVSNTSGISNVGSGNTLDANLTGGAN